MEELDLNREGSSPQGALNPEPSQGASDDELFRYMINETARTNGVDTGEAAAALEENGWDVLIMEQLREKYQQH